MKANVAFAIAISLLAGAADAQAAAPSDAPAAGSSAPRSDPGRTVSGVTVMPTPKPKGCSSRDKDCVALVVAELKQLYPEQLKRFCFQRALQARRSESNNDWLLEDLRSDSPPTPTSFGVNAALKVACAEDHQPDAKDSR